MKPLFTIWLTGLSGSGKTTAATLLASRLHHHGFAVQIIDGDVIRQQISPDLGFSREDRDENIRRITIHCNKLLSQGICVIVAAISPYREARQRARECLGCCRRSFIEVHMDCPLDVLVERDVKGLYMQALSGQLEHFTGVSDPYESPLNPEVTINSSRETPNQGIEKIWKLLFSNSTV